MLAQQEGRNDQWDYLIGNSVVYGLRHKTALWLNSWTGIYNLIDNLILQCLQVLLEFKHLGIMSQFSVSSEKDIMYDHG